MENPKGSFRKEIKRLASERKKRRERNERNLRKEYKNADASHCVFPYIGIVDDAGRGRPEKAVERLREYAELRNKMMLVTEEALVEVRKVIREEVRPKPMTVVQLRTVFRKVLIPYGCNPRKSYILELYRIKVAEPSRSVLEIENMMAVEMKRELSRLGLDFLTNTNKTVLKKLLVENAVSNQDPKPFEWDYHLSRYWIGLSRWYTKGVYPYEWMDGHDKFDVICLPPKEEFYSGLTGEDISDEDYERAKKVWKGIRGGVITAVMRYGAADNKYIGISDIPEGVIELMKDLNVRIRNDPTEIKEKVLDFENRLCVFLWDYGHEEDDKVMTYVKPNPENPAPTTVTDPVKTRVKDPRRVEAGKKLAAISQQAKAAKKARLEMERNGQQQEEIKEENKTSMFSLNNVCMVLGLGIGLGSLYLAWQSSCENKEKKDDDDEKEEKSIVEKEEPTEKDSERIPFDNRFD
ncbi:Hypothetical predicted protein [Paramuricea clavata]|uniref:Uncharacterized protein n=1 Tax=Paramuricea clavata TaxID=317549 RepID=A0A6S7GQQ6_PARCT|nr:Hypothetical predicted protein [Paramuricea clavata]